MVASFPTARLAPLVALLVVGVALLTFATFSLAGGRNLPSFGPIAPAKQPVIQQVDQPSIAPAPAETVIPQPLRLDVPTNLPAPTVGTGLTTTPPASVAPTAPAGAAPAPGVGPSRFADAEQSSGPMRLAPVPVAPMPGGRVPPRPGAISE